ncbi:GNAT family N-acetyltransferase [Agarivorans gilvus]|uniref:N-acetyltransferase n=1 Tax=Agarivorans gilvus TaxID=680279 RepID=A0ABQ1I3H1_9ALTE|nr:N-acetyltransferase [Agarivorans gilvus]GGB05155.1 N-acetyltransferase [Agarivorans gilvus]
MKHQQLDHTQHAEISQLFATTFAAAEGEAEGKMLGQLAEQLAAIIDQQQVLCFATVQDGQLVASIFFTQLQFQQPSQIFMLAPVAVSSEYQGRGIGQALIKYGLEQMQQRQVSSIVTYGDPAYYSKLGFAPLSEQVIQAPLPLSMPFGWQGLSLNDTPIAAIAQRPSCVAPFNDPQYW